MDIPDTLLQLQRASLAAREQATAGPYSAEAWAPWIAAGAELQAAITAHAAEAGANRYEVERAVKSAVLHPAEA